MVTDPIVPDFYPLLVHVSSALLKLYIGNSCIECINFLFESLEIGNLLVGQRIKIHPFCIRHHLFQFRCLCAMYFHNLKEVAHSLQSLLLCNSRKLFFIFFLQLLNQRDNFWYFRFSTRDGTPYLVEFSLSGHLTLQKENIRTVQAA